MAFIKGKQCPDARVIRGGDESMAMCDLVDKWCLVENGKPSDCDEYTGWLNSLAETSLIGRIKEADTMLREDFDEPVKKEE